MQVGSIGIIDEGPLKGRSFLIPAEVYVEKGKDPAGNLQYAKACLLHAMFIPDQGCQRCLQEMEQKAAEAERIGL